MRRAADSKRHCLPLRGLSATPNAAWSHLRVRKCCACVRTNCVHPAVVRGGVTGASTTPARSAGPFRKHITINRVHPRHLAVGTLGMSMKAGESKSGVRSRQVADSSRENEQAAKSRPTPGAPGTQKGSVRTHSGLAHPDSFPLFCINHQHHRLERWGAGLGMRASGVSLNSAAKTKTLTHPHIQPALGQEHK